MACLKRKTNNIIPEILRHEQVERFMNEGPDKKYLMVKIATIFGLFKTSRWKDLCNLLTENIEQINK